MATVQKLGEHGFRLTCNCGKHVVVPDSSQPSGYSVESVPAAEYEAMMKEVAERKRLDEQQAREHDEAERRNAEEKKRKEEEAEKKRKEAEGGKQHNRRLFGRGGN